MVLGSTSENVLRHATAPLLIFRLKMVEESGKPIRLIYQEVLRKILFPTDFSDCAQKALKYVKRLGKAGIEEVVIMHVRDVRIFMSEIMKKAPETERPDVQSLKKVGKELRALGIKTKTILVDGVPFIEIDKAAEKEGVSLIVMGSRGKSEVENMLLGSVCEQVVRHTTRPVLIVK
jgi:nucleotide-binding universal stress UspA family protein